MEAILIASLACGQTQIDPFPVLQYDAVLPATRRARALVLRHHLQLRALRHYTGRACAPEKRRRNVYSADCRHGAGGGVSGFQSLLRPLPHRCRPAADPAVGPVSNPVFFCLAVKKVLPLKNTDPVLLQIGVAGRIIHGGQPIANLGSLSRRQITLPWGGTSCWSF